MFCQSEDDSGHNADECDAVLLDDAAELLDLKGGHYEDFVAAIDGEVEDSCQSWEAVSGFSIGVGAALMQLLRCAKFALW